MNANVLKVLYREYVELVKLADIADAEYEADPENEEKENAFDLAYGKQFTKGEELAKAIVQFSNGKIDKKTAFLMMWEHPLKFKKIIESI